MRALTSGERALLGGQHFLVYQALDVIDANGVWIDCSQLFGGDWLTEATLTQDLDNVVGQATFVLAREGQTPSLGIVSLSPLVSASPANNGGPLFDYERPIRFRTATVAPGTARPAAGDGTWRHVFFGKVTGIEAGGTSNSITITALDEGSRLADAQVRAKTVYSDEDGTLVELVMQQMLSDWAPFMPAIVVPVSPGWAIKQFEQEEGSLLTALRDKLALQIGWDFRFRWTGPTTFVPVFQRPERVTPTVQATFGANEYLAIPRLGGTGDDIRNVGAVEFSDSASGERVTVTGQNTASITRFGGTGKGERWFKLSLGSDSNIDSAVEAQALLDSALSDLGFPTVDVDVETLYWWPAEIGDFYQFGANGDQFTSDQAFGVIKITHHFTRTEQHTTFGVRGVPSAAYRTWLDLPQSLGGTATTTPLRLHNFREKTRDDLGITYTWDDGDLATRCKEIWVWSNTLTQDDVRERWPDENAAPSMRLTPDTRELVVPWPVRGSVTYEQWVPMTLALLPGDAQRETVSSIGDPPRIGTVTQTPDVSGLHVTLTIELIDPQAWGGFFAVWTNHDDVADATGTGAAEGTATIPSTPYTATGTTPFANGFGTLTLLRDIRVQPSRGKVIFVEFVNSRGTTSGRQRITILPGDGGILDADGNLIDEAINAARQFASGIKPVRVIATRTGYDGAANGFGEDDLAAVIDEDGKLYRWHGGAWDPVVKASHLDEQIVSAQIANEAVNTAHFAAGIAPVRLIANTATGGTENDVALDESTGFLMRFRSGAWTNNLPASVLSGQIVSSQIANGAVAAVNLAVAAVTAAAIAVGAINTTAIANGAVTAAQLGAAAVQTANIATSAITSTLIAADAVTTPKIAAGAVVTGSITAGAITTGTLASGAVTTAILAAGAVTANEIASGAVTTVKLVAGAVTANEIAANAVTAVAINAGAITTPKIFAGAITANELATNSVTTIKVVAGAITSNELAANSVIAGKVQAGAISTTELAAGAVTTAKIFAGAVTTNALAAGAVTAVKIQAGAITANEIATGTITANELAANSIVAGKIAAGAVTATAIQAKAVKATHLEISVLSDVKDASGNTLGLGIIVSGRLNAVASGAYLDLNATGSGAVLYHPAFALYASGVAIFAGEVQSGSFTATTATFTGTVIVNNTFYADAWRINGSGLTPWSLTVSYDAGTASTLFANTTGTGIIFGLSAARLGFFGSSGTTRQALFGSLQVDAGSHHIPALDALIALFVGHGFLLDFTTP